MDRVCHGNDEKKVEIGFSVLTYLFPKTIHAKTNEGFALKSAFFIMAFSCLQALFT